jgi:hypothetical protein
MDWPWVSTLLPHLPYWHLPCPKPVGRGGQIPGKRAGKVKTCPIVTACEEEKRKEGAEHTWWNAEGNRGDDEGNKTFRIVCAVRWLDWVRFHVQSIAPTPFDSANGGCIQNQTIVSASLVHSLHVPWSTKRSHDTSWHAWAMWCVLS